ncbi:MAG: hypothetical protein M3245_02035 [Actinomycetota bacterium]|nr:hypothetical protein [Actinomycetota bacterium]
MAQRPGFDLNRLSMGTKVLLGAGLVLFIALFLGWNCFGGFCLSGWSGMGVLAGLLVLALLVWEGLELAGVLATVNAPKALIAAGLGAGAALFALIRFFQAMQGLGVGAIIGLIAALGLGYGAWLRFNESKTAPGGLPPTSAPPPPPPAT